MNEPAHYLIGEAARMELVVGNIVHETTDAIVNAANSSLLGGGGVDGAIHAAAGPTLLDECRKIHDQRGPLPAGQAVATRAGNLKVRYVIHTVGPVWNGGKLGEDGLLASCYRRSLELCEQYGLVSVAFPAISTGIYRFPADRAADIAVKTTADMLASVPALSRVIFCCFSDDSARLHEAAMTRL